MKNRISTNQYRGDSRLGVLGALVVNTPVLEP
jgi:hypothetical protein